MASWQTLLALDRKSDDFTRSAKKLLGDQRDRKLEVPQLSEDETIKLIELIEPVVGLSPWCETGAG